MQHFSMESSVKHNLKKKINNYKKIKKIKTQIEKFNLCLLFAPIVRWISTFYKKK